ncbi:MAG TPA: DUF2269 family protein [Candidatus Eremiobacteraceae bacterium]|nr:DUF2269 family protein [Candidatus Eremiobacteraceae bacterium]
MQIFLHVLSMFVAFALTVGVGIASTAIARTRDVRAIRAAAKIAQPLQLTGGIFIVVGVIFGFATAASAGYSLGSTWLVVGYVCAALLLIAGVAVHRTWLVRISKAAQASPDDRPSGDLNVLIDDRFVQAAGPLTGLVWLVAIAVMTLKP